MRSLPISDRLLQVRLISLPCLAWWVSQGCLGVRRWVGRSLVARGQRCHVLRQLLSTCSIVAALSYGMAASTRLKQPRYPRGTRKHGRCSSDPSPKLIQPGCAVGGTAETRLVGKLSASHSQSAYAIYTAAPTAVPCSWSLDCSQEDSQDPGIRKHQMRNGRGHGSGKTKRHQPAEVSPGVPPQPHLCSTPNRAQLMARS
ncbi:hypothetical protein J3F84DRAFT_54271 [Trichoderma pleuroticola]